MSDDKHLKAKKHIFQKSDELEGPKVEIRGLDFNSSVNLSQLLESYHSTGYQATNLSISMDIINKMVSHIKL